MHRFNILSNSIIDCDGDGDTVFEGEFPSISIQENIRIYGGDIVFEDQKPGGTYEWDCDKYFRADVNKMWEICKEDIRLWNTQLGVLAAAERYRDEWQAPMTTVASVDKITAYLSQKKSKFIFAKSFLAKLQKAGLITDYYCDERNLTVSYKNEQVKRCLVKAGQVLEMKIYLAALDACEQDGSYTYYDVLNGVNIDWDGDIHTDDEVYDTQNEIDVIMMKGMIPVFVSCKNGTVDISELYKLDSVAEAFGGRYAKKVLVTTSLETMTDFEGYFRQRAKDMNIRIVDNVQYMSEAELEKEIKTFWNIT